MVDSILGNQQSITICFSFTAGLTWCAAASQVRSTNTFFSHLAGAQFADCINCLTTRRILLPFQHTIAFSPIRICFSLYLSKYNHSYVSFICKLSIPECCHRISRGIHQHIFSRMAGEHFADCITCLTLLIILLWFEQSINFSPTYILELEYVWICFISMFHSFPSLHPTVLP